MSTRLSLILSLIFALLQGTFLPPVFLEGFLVIFLVLARTFQSAGVTLLGVGITFDLLQNQPLGTTSLILLSVGAVISYLSTTFPISQPVALAVFVVAINTIRHLLLFGKFELGGSLILFAISFLLFWFLSRSNFSSLLFSRRVGKYVF